MNDIGMLVAEGGFQIGDGSVLSWVLLSFPSYVIAYGFTWVWVKWFFQWRSFQRPASEIPPPGRRGTIEGTIRAGEELIPVLYDPSIECVAWYVWWNLVDTEKCYQRSRPFVLETSFGQRVRVVIRDAEWHVARTWDAELVAAEHRGREEFIQTSLHQAAEERNDKWDIGPLHPLAFPSYSHESGTAKMAVFRPGDRVTLSGDFEIVEQGLDPEGYRGVSAGMITVAVDGTPAWFERPAILTKGDYETVTRFGSPLQRWVRLAIMSLAALFAMFPLTAFAIALRP
jgi:hypothetical protein